MLVTTMETQQIQQKSSLIYAVNSIGPTGPIWSTYVAIWDPEVDVRAKIKIIH